MKLLTVIGLCLDLVGVVILGVGEVMKGAAALRELKKNYTDSFHYDVQQRPRYVRTLIRLGAALGARTIKVQRELPPYRAFPLSVYEQNLINLRRNETQHCSVSQCTILSQTLRELLQHWPQEIS